MSFIINHHRKRHYVDIIEGILSLVLQYEDCIKTGHRSSAAPVLLTHDVSGQNIEIQMEYFIYINTYGLPETGMFDEVILGRIRSQLIV